MGKRIIPFGSSNIDAIVMEWLKNNGINPNIVSGYNIERNAGHFSTITLKCPFEDEPAEQQEG